MMASSFVLRTYGVLRDLTSVWGQTQLVRNYMPGIRHSDWFTYVPDAAPPGTGYTELMLMCWLSNFAH